MHVLELTLTLWTILKTDLKGGVGLVPFTYRGTYHALYAFLIRKKLTRQCIHSARYKVVCMYSLICHVNSMFP